MRDRRTGISAGGNAGCGEVAELELGDRNDADGGGVSTGRGDEMM
jgi:hypothetical protein